METTCVCVCVCVCVNVGVYQYYLFFLLFLRKMSSYIFYAFAIDNVVTLPLVVPT